LISPGPEISEVDRDTRAEPSEGPASQDGRAHFRKWLENLLRPLQKIFEKAPKPARAVDRPKQSTRGAGAAVKARSSVRVMNRDVEFKESRLANAIRRLEKFSSIRPNG
jgi:hypothetical protein